MSRCPDALVIGGGVAGAACAAWLARAGRRVVLLEREPVTPHKVCGEFLSYEALRYLQALGIVPRALGAVPVETVRIAAGNRSASSRLPFTAMSLSRRRLDEALLRRAAADGAELRRGTPVRALVQREGAWQARLRSGETVEADTVFLATGKHDLRGWRRPAGRQPDLIGLKMHWRLADAQAAALGRSVELTLFPGGYSGLEPVEDGRANLCLLVQSGRFGAPGRSLGQSWVALVDAIRAASPLLDRRLTGAAPCWERPLAIGRIPFGHVRRGGGAPWRLGDQAAVTPSFTGDGLAIALHSAWLAARKYLAGDVADGFHRALARDVAAPVRRGMWLSRMLVNTRAQAVIADTARLVPRLTTWCIAGTRLPENVLLSLNDHRKSGRFSLTRF